MKRLRLAFAGAALVAAVGCDQCQQSLPSGWALLREAQPGALLSVNVAGGAVWISGGDPDSVSGPATGTLLVDDDPTDDVDFTAIDTGLQSDLWWVHPMSATVAWLGGSTGRVVRVDRGTTPVTIDDVPTPATALADPDIIVFGVFATDDGSGSVDGADVWAVGGRTGGNTGGFIWHKAPGGDFVDVVVPADVAGYAIWKVAGTSADDVWMVGTSGQAFVADSSGTVTAIGTGLNASLFTVDVNTDGALAVGGGGRGLVMSRGTTDDTWVDVTPDGDNTPPLLGVHRGATDGLLVGSAGAAYSVRDGVMKPEAFGFNMFQSLHSCFVDDDSGLAWAVGGQLTGIPLTNGVLLRRAP